jgi:hypothetical protein
MGFRVKYKSEKLLINALKELKEIGALGEKIGMSTSYEDSENTEDIITGKLKIYTENSYDNDDVCELSIGIEDRTEILEEFNSLFGKNGICVSFSTRFDVKQGDIYNVIIPYKNLIEETKKLMC